MRNQKFIVEECKNATKEWFNECFEHKLKLLEFLISVLFRKHCIWMVEKRKETRNRKLKII